MAGYAGRHIAAGGRLAHVTRHMVGLFHGLPGARRYRQILSTDATRPGAGPEVLARRFRRGRSFGKGEGGRLNFSGCAAFAGVHPVACFRALSRMLVSVELMPSISRSRRSVSSNEARSRSSSSATKSQRPLVE